MWACGRGITRGGRTSAVSGANTNICNQRRDDLAFFHLDGSHNVGGGPGERVTLDGDFASLGAGSGVGGKENTELSPNHLHVEYPEEYQ